MKPESRLSISFLTTSFPRYKGDFAGNFILAFARELVNLGATIEVSAPESHDTKQLPLPPEIKLTRFEYFFSQSPQSLSSGSGIPNRIKTNSGSLIQLPFMLLAFFFKALRSARKSDLLHAYWSPAGLVSVIAGLIKSKPVVITLWGSDFIFLKTPVLSHLLRIILDKADTIICENQHFKNQLVQLDFHNKSIHVIPNGIDFELFKPREEKSARSQLGLPEDGIIILSIGSLTKNKGHHYLIQAFSQLAQERKDIHLRIVGGGEEYQSLINQIERLELAEKVTLAGHADHEAISKWLNAADIFVLPSMREGTPNTLLEAMASGLPVIASATGGISDVIDEGSCGMLISPASVEELKNKLRQLISSDNLRDRLGKNARLKIEADYGSWQTQAGKLYSVYQELLRKNQTSS